MLHYTMPPYIFAGILNLNPLALPSQRRGGEQASSLGALFYFFILGKLPKGVAAGDLKGLLLQGYCPQLSTIVLSTGYN